MTNNTPYPVNIVILGATGDLAKRKIFPALANLYREREIGPETRIVGFARKAYDDDSFRAYVKEVTAASGACKEGACDDLFLSRIFYSAGDLDDAPAYARLDERINALDQADGVPCSNRLFYLAVPPTLYEGIFRKLHESGLMTPCADHGGWRRLAVEKPFGRDLVSARELDRLLHKLYDEEQIYRIDHYLGKRSLQNILSLRFANEFFAPLWCREHVESVHIRFHETLDVAGRGSFYDGVGALRDIGQNHLLQLLAAVAMEEPENMGAQAVQRARTRLLRELVVPQVDEKQIMRGQYSGYRKEEGVALNSETETYFRIATTIENERFRGIPVVLEGGKALAVNEVSVRLRLRSRASSLFGEAGPLAANEISLRMQPDPNVSISFLARAPGFEHHLAPRELGFSFDSDDDDPMTARHEAYEHVLRSCVMGDQTMFTDNEEIEAAWAFVTPIMEGWHALPLTIYERGSSGSVAVK